MSITSSENKELLLQLLDNHPNFTKDRRVLINEWLKNKILGK